MQVTLYENEFLSTSTSLSMSRIGSKGAPEVSMFGRHCRVPVASVTRPEEVCGISARRTASEQLPL